MDSSWMFLLLLVLCFFVLPLFTYLVPHSHFNAISHTTKPSYCVAATSDEKTCTTMTIYPRENEMTRETTSFDLLMIGNKQTLPTK